MNIFIWNEEITVIHVKDICSQILTCERDREGEERKFIFDVILILYASLSNYYKANYLLQLLN